ncbi:MAG TPA: DUF692 domain-containing protein [Candidatus Limnocylindria bacterium]|nr:DUF692 domain-containing protein [Candidatus Limnocylindria bacterium]
MSADVRTPVSPPWPRLGGGMGLRREHYELVLAERPPVGWFEVVTENYLDTGGRPLAVLEAVRRDYPVALHGVALSIGSADPLNEQYLERLARLVARIEPVFVTDHLCWTGVDGRSLYDLLPVPYTEEALAHVAERVRRVQDRLGRRILLENPSTYIEYRCSQMPEWEFLAALAEQTDCGILLDVNNVYVTCTNHGHDARRYLDAILPGRVGYVHLGGFTDLGTFLFDTHGSAVAPEVWSLYEQAVRRIGPVSTLVEWDTDVPPFATVHAEVVRARAVMEKVHGGAVAA